MVYKISLTKKIIGISMCVIAFGAILMMALQTGTSDIWYDEVFSVAFAKMSVTDLVHMTALDVHPPLYYLYLKFFTMAGMTLFGEGAYITLCKIASVLPWFFIALISITLIRRKWNIFVTGLFLMLVTMMPQIGNYYVEIRMYSFALLLITLCGLAAIYIYASESKGKRIWWCVLFVTGIMTAYTQYYACIGIAGIYIGLLLALLISKKEGIKKDILRLLFCIILSIITYIPWIPVVYRQFSNISGNYWIQPLTIRSIAGCVKFIFLPVCDKTLLSYLTVGGMLLVCAFVIIMSIIYNRKTTVLYLCIFIMPLLLVVLSGFVLSAMGTPIFVYRYMIPVLGLFWLYIALCIDKITDKGWMIILLVIPFLMAGILVCRGFYLEEHKKVEHMPLVENAFDLIPQDAAIVCNFDHVAAISGYYLKSNDIYLYEGEIDPILYKIFDGCGECANTDTICSLLLNGKDVYFFGSFNSREDIIKEWAEEGIEASEQDSVLLERYWFNIYRLDRK